MSKSESRQSPTQSIDESSSPLWDPGSAIHFADFQINESSPLAWDPCHNKNLYPLACWQKDLRVTGSPLVWFSSYRSSHCRGDRHIQHHLLSLANSLKQREKLTFTVLVLTQKILNMQVSKRITKWSLHLNISIDDVKGLCCTCEGCGFTLSWCLMKARTEYLKYLPFLKKNILTYSYTHYTSILL